MAEPGGTDGGTRRYSVPQAARLLAISERAVRKRIAVGSLTAEREGNRWWVLLNGAADAAPGTADAAPEVVPAEPDAVPTAPGAVPVPDGETPLVAQLRSENDYLREALRRSQEAEGEQRRIIAGLMARLPELTAGTANPPAEKSTIETSTDAPGPNQATVELRLPHPAPDTQPGAGVPRRPWWRFWANA